MMVMPWRARGVERRVDIPEHEIVEADRPPAVAEANACAAVAEQKPPHVLHARRGKLGERRCSSRARSSLLRDPAIGPPGIGAEIDAVVDPRQVGADQKRRR